MLNKADVMRIIGDILRTELAHYKEDAQALFETDKQDGLFSRLPPGLLQNVFVKAAAAFNFEPRPFSGLKLLAEYAFASYLKKGGITFLTSASAGTPKKCFHSNEMIWQEASGVKFLFSGVKRVVSLVPASHLYGFTFAVALPHALQVPAGPLAALPGRPLENIFQPGDLAVGFPLFWERWLRGGHQFPQGVRVLSSTAPCKDEIIQGLLNTGAESFTEIYGASETGAIARRHAPGTAFELFPFWETSVDGEPKIRRAGTREWLRLPDRVELKGERFLIPLNRMNECVQVAGINVRPKRAEKVLAAHPAVKECRVRLMRPEEGNRLKAFIVFNDGYSQEHLGIIRTYLAQKLTEHELPHSFTVGARLPVSLLGKDADW